MRPGEGGGEMGMKGRAANCPLAKRFLGEFMK
jgi:hypothetical protein